MAGARTHLRRRSRELVLVRCPNRFHCRRPGLIRRRPLLLQSCLGKSGEVTCFGARRPARGIDRPEIDGRQRPIGQHTSCWQGPPRRRRIFSDAFMNNDAEAVVYMGGIDLRDAPVTPDPHRDHCLEEHFRGRRCVPVLGTAGTVLGVESDTALSRRAPAYLDNGQVVLPGSIAVNGYEVSRVSSGQTRGVVKTPPNDLGQWIASHGHGHPSPQRAVTRPNTGAPCRGSVARHAHASLEATGRRAGRHRCPRYVGGLTGPTLGRIARTRSNIDRVLPDVDRLTAALMTISALPNNKEMDTQK